MFRDNGIGLSPEDQQRIFAPFVRLHGVEDYPGSGPRPFGDEAGGGDHRRTDRRLFHVGERKHVLD